MVSRMVTGRDLKISPDPPNYVAAPWWPVTVLVKITGSGNFTGEEIYNQVIINLALTDYKYVKPPKSSVDVGLPRAVCRPLPQAADGDNIPLTMRLDSVRAWSLDKGAIQLAICDFIDGNRYMKEINDLGSALNYGRVGYTFGCIPRYNAFSKADKDTLFYVSTATASAAALVYINLHVRISDVGPMQVSTTTSSMSLDQIRSMQDSPFADLEGLTIA